MAGALTPFNLLSNQDQLILAETTFTNTLYGRTQPHLINGTGFIDKLLPSTSATPVHTFLHSPPTTN